MTVAQAIDFGHPEVRRRSLLRYWQGRLRGSEFTWAVAFIIPYIGVFLAFVVYPVLYGAWMGSDPRLYSELFSDPIYQSTVVNTLLFLVFGVNLKLFLALLLSGFFMRPGWPIKALLMIFILPWAVPALPTFISIHWMLNGEWGLLNNALYTLFGIDGPSWLNERWLALGTAICAHVWKWLPFWTVILLAGRMSIPHEISDAAKVDGATGLRGFIYVTFPLLANLYLVLTLLATIFLLGDFNTVTFVTGGGPANSTHVLATLGIRDAYDMGHPKLGVAAVMSALPLMIPLVIILMRKLAYHRGATMSTTTADLHVLPRTAGRMRRIAMRRRYLSNAAATVLGVVIVVWTLLPIYNMIMVSLEPEGDVFTETIWPAHPSAASFWIVITEGYWYLEYFWHQFGNSLFIAIMTTLLVVLIGSMTSYSVARMRIKNGWLITNAALLTYVIPASFLAIPFYLIMNDYGLHDNPWSVIAALVTFATPYAIFIFQEYGRGIPLELDESARIDGASPIQIYVRIYLPLMAPALVAVGTYALLLAWNEYLYQFLLLSNKESMTVPVALAQFLNSDQAPWNYMMATAIIYALPPIATYYAFRGRMSSGLTMGGVKG